MVVNLNPRRPVALLVLPVALLAGCGGSPSDASTSTSASASATPSASPTPTVAAATAPVRRTNVGVFVTGNFGQKPTLTVPTGDPPTAEGAEVLSAGTGGKVTSGQTLVVNYLGQTWDLKDGKANIFDNSYDRGAVSGFRIGTGAVIAGWDSTLVGQRVGSRLLLSIPPAQAYGATANPSNELAGHTLLFVVDIIAAIRKDIAADGTPAGSLPAGMPSVTSEPGKKPSITSVKGVTAGSTPTSALLLTGRGAPIEEKKTLALEIIQTDLATGKQTQQTWGKGPELVPAADVLAVATALKGQRIGSRVVATTPKSGNRAPVALIIDVVGQY